MKALIGLVLAWFSGRALAAYEMNRFGTMVYVEDGAGDVGLGGFAFLGALGVLTYVLYRVFKRWWPQYSDEANFNFAWIAVLVFGCVLLALSR